MVARAHLGSQMDLRAGNAPEDVPAMTSGP
jgi:hypothetical protein